MLFVQSEQQSEISHSFHSGSTSEMVLKNNIGVFFYDNPNNAQHCNEQLFLPLTKLSIFFRLIDSSRLFLFFSITFLT